MSVACKWKMYLRPKIFKIFLEATVCNSKAPLNPRKARGSVTARFPKGNLKRDAIRIADESGDDLFSPGFFKGHF